MKTIELNIHNALLWCISSIGVLAIGVLFGFLFSQKMDSKFEFLTPNTSVKECIDSFGGLERADFDIQFDSLDFCYASLYKQALLNEFSIRRIIFRNQHVADVVLLWMVVTLTLSGVILAALQMIASYKLASQNGNGLENAADSHHEIRIERGKLVFRSAMSGLMILLMSFAFFYIYILFVYKIDVLQIHDNPSAEGLDLQYQEPSEISERLGWGGIMDVPETVDNLTEP